jgi:hypothetical protein
MRISYPVVWGSMLVSTIIVPHLEHDGQFDTSLADDACM